MKLPEITLARKSGWEKFAKNLKATGKMATYVGIPAATDERRAKYAEQSANIKGTGKRADRKRARLKKLSSGEGLNNAELLFIHTKGSPKRKIPARPVVEPAIEADGNRQAISSELKAYGQAQLAGDQAEARRRIKRAGMAGQNAARSWFTDGRNNWAPNAPSTIARKGSDKPLIDTGALRAAITHVEKEEP